MKKLTKNVHLCFAANYVALCTFSRKTSFTIMIHATTAKHVKKKATSNQRGTIVGLALVGDVASVFISATTGKSDAGILRNTLRTVTP